jgi:glutathione S-transferase
VTVVITWLLIGGLRYEWIAVGAGSVFLIARLIYTIGYSSKGPEGRLIGFIIQFLASILLLILAILSPLKMAGIYTDSYP